MGKRKKNKSNKGEKKNSSAKKGNKRMKKGAMANAIIQVFKASPKEPFNYRQISSKIGADNPVQKKQVVEPAGACSLAAVLNHKIDVADKRVVCVLSGGNIDVSFIHKVVEKGLVTRGRNMKFKTPMLDVPGSLEKIAGILHEVNANIIEVRYDRISADLNLNETIIHMGGEVSSKEHGEAMIRELRANGYDVTLE